MSSRVGVLSAGLGAVLLFGGCSDDDAVAPSSPVAVSTTSVSTGTGTGVPTAPELRVDQIAAAVQAVEDERGGPQRYFEINATPTLVNLFVADEDAGQVIPYVYVAGELTGEEPSDAQGNTFSSEAIDLLPDEVTARVTAELPDSVQEAFVIEGGPDGTLRYSIVVSSSAGGQLLVVVARDGVILSVDTVT